MQGRKSCTTSRGFTLIELVIVMGLIIIVSMGVTFSVRGNNYRVLHNASLALQSDLRYAQRRAITEGRRHGIVFERVSNRYHIVLNHPRELIRTVYLPRGVIIQDITANQLMFLPRGTASSGFSITLANGNYRQELTATVSGGRIRVWDIVQN